MVWTEVSGPDLELPARGPAGAAGANGVLSNVRLAKSGAYTVANADKGKTFELTGGAYDLTFSAASGYDADFAVVVTNNTATAKTLVLSGHDDVILRDNEAVLVLNVNSAWMVLGGFNNDYERESLTANRDYFVGYDMGVGAMSVASPAVVTKVAHGLVADSRISFSILPNKTAATISVASPAVVTMANSFVAGQPIMFETSGRLPVGITPAGPGVYAGGGGLTAGTTYYVLASGLSATEFQFSASVGGAAVNTSNPTVTISNASPGVVTEATHGRSAGDAIQLATDGALPTGLAVATTYFVKTVLDPDTYTVSATPEGAAINTSSAGSGTHTIVQFGLHFVSETGALPTGVTAGQEYWVLATDLADDTFKFSATSGGAAINSSGSTEGNIRLRTGSDSNDGLANTAAQAFLTIGGAVDFVTNAIDMRNYQVRIFVDDGKYNEDVLLKVMPGQRDQGLAVLRGNLTQPGNCWIASTSFGIRASGFGPSWRVDGFKISTSGAGPCINAHAGAWLRCGEMEFATCGAQQILADHGGHVEMEAHYTISGGGLVHWAAGQIGYLLVLGGRTVTILNRPDFDSQFAQSVENSVINVPAVTFEGLATGNRYAANTGGGIKTSTGSATYLPGSLAEQTVSPFWYT